MSHNRISNVVVQMSAIAPITGAATYTGDVWVDMASLTTGQYEILANIHCGVVGTSVDAQLMQATDNAGTGSKVVPNKVITQITTTGDIAKIELRHDDADLDDANGFGFVNLQIVTVGATTAVSGEIVGGVYPLQQDSVGLQSYDQADEAIRKTIT